MLTENYIDSLAPNAAAIKNGKGLIKKFILLQKSEDETLLFGACSGSGKNPYITSVDFIFEQPTFRCSCPSRQFPCKHGLGLLYAYVNGSTFQVADVPEDILQKREKLEKRTETKKEEKPKKVNKTALKKKLQAQLDGINTLETLLHQIVRGGLMAVDTQTLANIEKTAKELGNYYLKGTQNKLYEFAFLWKKQLPEAELFARASEQLAILYAVCTKGKTHLQQRMETEDLTPDISSSLEEWLGHTWQITELREHNLVKQDEKLIQLSFSCTQNKARKEFIDEGIWLSLIDGEVYYTHNYRPFRASAHIKQEDTIFGVVEAKEIVLYPSEGTRRIRFEDHSLHEWTNEDFKLAKNHAKQNFTDVVKQVKNQLKIPLADKHPVYLLAFEKLGAINENWVVEDSSGNRLVVQSNTLLPMIAKEDRTNQALLVKFTHDFSNGILKVIPLSIVTDSQILYLTV